MANSRSRSKANNNKGQLVRERVERKGLIIPHVKGVEKDIRASAGQQPIRTDLIYHPCHLVMVMTVNQLSLAITRQRTINRRPRSQLLICCFQPSLKQSSQRKTRLCILQRRHSLMMQILLMQPSQLQQYRMWILPTASKKLQV